MYACMYVYILQKVSEQSVSLQKGIDYSDTLYSYTFCSPARITNYLFAYVNNFASFDSVRTSWRARRSPRSAIWPGHTHKNQLPSLHVCIVKYLSPVKSYLVRKTFLCIFDEPYSFCIEFPESYMIVWSVYKLPSFWYIAYLTNIFIVELIMCVPWQLRDPRSRRTQPVSGETTLFHSWNYLF